jgi:hypothetical protein
MAIAYVDRVRARVYVQNGPRLILTAVACLVVAAKFLETCQEPEGYSLLPSLMHYLAAMGNPANITRRHLRSYERCVLHVLDWRLRSGVGGEACGVWGVGCGVSDWRLSSGICAATIIFFTYAFTQTLNPKS